MRLRVSRVALAATIAASGTFVSACSSDDGSSCSHALSWSDARSNAGERRAYLGDLKSIRYAKDGAATFLNVGKDYPDPYRLSVVVWSEDADNFPDLRPLIGMELCVQGAVQFFQGVTQIEIDGPEDLYDAEDVAPPDTPIGPFG